MSDAVPRPLASGPTLSELATDPGLLEQLSTELLVNVRRQLRHLDCDLDAILAKRLVRHDGPAAPAEPDRLLDKAEAAQIAGVTPAWLLRQAKRLPFARKLSPKVVRFSEQGLRRWLTTRRP